MRRKTTIVNYADEHNPNSMESSKEERIAARRLRIQQKLAMKHGAGSSGLRGAVITLEEKADVRIGE